MEFVEFSQLDDEETFVKIVSTYIKTAFADVTKNHVCEPLIDESRIKLAHGEYTQAIQRFAVLLDSENPDHFKRSGALLYSLYQTEPIVDILVDGDSLEELEAHTGVGKSYADEQHMIDYVDFLDEYVNELIAFDLAFRCCDTYEGGEHEYTYDFLHNMAYYMKQNSSLSVASFAMIFKAYMA